MVSVDDEAGIEVLVAAAGGSDERDSVATVAVDDGDRIIDADKRSENKKGRVVWLLGKTENTKRERKNDD
jgi:hypothetical protein